MNSRGPRADSRATPYKSWYEDDLEPSMLTEKERLGK